MPQTENLEAFVKTRVKASDKAKVEKIADDRQLDVSDIVREAIREYVNKHLPAKRARA